MKTDMGKPTCERLIQSLSEYIDGTLDDSLCRVLEEHLDGCEDCQIVYNTTLKTIDLFHASGEKVELPEAVRTRLFVRLNLDEYLEEDSKLSK
jgi:anti-sigma factor (TIGR02949 family)